MNSASLLFVITAGCCWGSPAEQWLVTGPAHRQTFRGSPLVHTPCTLLHTVCRLPRSPCRTVNSGSRSVTGDELTRGEAPAADGCGDVRGVEQGSVGAAMAPRPGLSRRPWPPSGTDLPRGKQSADLSKVCVCKTSHAGQFGGLIHQIVCS